MASYLISSDPKDFDFEVIYQFVSQSYWARGIPRDTLSKALDNSLCFAVLKQGD